MREHDKETLEDYGKATRSRKPRYALIPHCALNDLAERFELGQIKHGGKAWNAHSKNKTEALTKEWVVAAMEHVIHHAMTAIDKLHGINHEEDNDAGAIMFGGAVLSAYNELVGKIERN
jgi:hypothetical protein